MFHTASKMLVLALLCLATNYASAWVAVAQGDSGYAFASSDASSAEQATNDALEGCGKQSAGCSLVTGPVIGPVALVIVRGDAGISVATSRNPSVAEANASKDCGSRYQNCRLDLASWDEGEKWYAIAMGDGGAFVSYSASSRAEAERLALDGCRKRTATSQSCTIRTSDTGSTWIAVVESKSVSVWSVGQTKEAALQRGRGDCERAAKAETCDHTDLMFNPAAVAAPAALTQMQKRIEQRKKVAGGSYATKPKADAVTRYTESCRNADCVRKYENGKTVRYTACLNPTTALPMNDPARLGGCGGTDARGNFFGMGNL